MVLRYIGPSIGSTVQTGEIDDNAITLAKMASGTDGNLITYNASGDPAAVATGTAAQVLTSNGAGAAPTFQAAAGGGGKLELISSVTGSGSNISFDTISGYKYLRLIGHLASSTITNRAVTLTFNADGGSNYQFNDISTATVASTTGATSIPLGTINTTAVSNFDIIIGVEDLGTAGNDHSIIGTCGGGLAQSKFIGRGNYQSATAVAITAIDIDIPSDNFVGEVTLYGVAEV